MHALKALTQPTPTTDPQQVGQFPVEQCASEGLCCRCCNLMTITLLTGTVLAVSGLALSIFLHLHLAISALFGTVAFIAFVATFFVDNLNSSGADLKIAQDTIKNLNADKETFTATQAQALAELTAKHQAAVNELEERINTLTSGDNRQTRIDELSKELSKVRDELKTAKDAQSQALAAFRGKEAELAELTTTHASALEAKQTELSNAILAKDTAHGLENTRLEGVIAGLRTEIEGLKRDHAAALEAKTKEISNLKTQLEEAAASVQEKDTKIADLNQTHQEALAKQTRESDSANAKLKQQVAELRAQLETATAALASAQAEHSTALAAKTAELAKATEAHKKALDTEKAQFDAQIQLLRTEIATLNTQHSQSLQAKTKEIRTLREEFKTKETEYTKASREKDSAHELARADFAKEIEVLNKRLVLADSSQARAADARITALTRELADLNITLNEARQERDTSVDNLRHKGLELTEKDLAIADLKESHRKITEEKDETITKLRSLIAAKTAELTAAKEGAELELNGEVTELKKLNMRLLATYSAAVNAAMNAIQLDSSSEVNIAHVLTKVNQEDVRVIMAMRRMLDSLMHCNNQNNTPNSKGAEASFAGLGKCSKDLAATIARTIIRFSLTPPAELNKGDNNEELEALKLALHAHKISFEKELDSLLGKEYAPDDAGSSSKKTKKASDETGPNPRFLNQVRNAITIGIGVNIILEVNNSQPIQQLRDFSSRSPVGENGEKSTERIQREENKIKLDELLMEMENLPLNAFIGNLMKRLNDYLPKPIDKKGKK